MNLITDMMNCKTTREVDAFVTKNLYDRSPYEKSKIQKFANVIKKRIVTVEREKKISHSLHLN